MLAKYIKNNIMIFFIIIFLFSCGSKSNFQQKTNEQNHEQKEDILNMNSLSNIENPKTSGIILSFDDYYPDSWEKYFELFDKYNAKVTFFVRLESPTTFCFNAQKHGHEIGYHTINHEYLAKVTKERFYEETISNIDLFRNQGIELTSFAYPYGSYEEWMNNELLKYYRIVRGYGVKKSSIYSIDGFIKNGFVYSKSIDNISYKSEELFQNDITKMMELTAAKQNSILLLTSHIIGKSNWGITSDRLEFILKKAKELNLAFYKYNDFR